MIDTFTPLGVGSEYSCSRSGCRGGHFFVTGKPDRSLTATLSPAHWLSRPARFVASSPALTAGWPRRPSVAARPAQGRLRRERGGGRIAGVRSPVIAAVPCCKTRETLPTRRHLELNSYLTACGGFQPTPNNTKEVVMLADILSRYWWMTLLRGLFWILFGIVIFARPGISLLSLTFALGVIMFVDGIINTANAFSGRKEHDDWWVLLLVGLAGIGIGLLTFYNPEATALAVVLYVAIWAIATGLLEIVAAIRLRRQIEGEFWLALAGIASVVFGGLLIARPGTGALTILWLIGVYAIAFGVILLLLAFKVRSGVKRIAGALHA